MWGSGNEYIETPDYMVVYRGRGGQREAILPSSFQSS